PPVTGTASSTTKLPKKSLASPLPDTSWTACETTTVIGPPAKRSKPATWNRTLRLSSKVSIKLTEPWLPLAMQNIVSTVRVAGFTGSENPISTNTLPLEPGFDCATDPSAGVMEITWGGV